MPAQGGRPLPTKVDEVSTLVSSAERAPTDNLGCDKTPAQVDERGGPTCGSVVMRSSGAGGPGPGYAAGSRRATHSTCWVIGKQSKARRAVSCQPSERKVPTSRARAAGSQAT